MLEFITREVASGRDSTQAACLITPISDIQEVPQALIKDGEALALPEDLTQRIAKAIRRIHRWEERGLGADCTAFGVTAMDGLVSPVPEQTYKTDLHWLLHFGKWLDQDDAFEAAPGEQFVEFGKWEDRFYPRHAAIKLPGVEDLFIQKMGHHLPIAITNAIPTFRFHHANALATIDGVLVRHASNPVLTYLSPSPAESPAATYHGLPG